MSSPDQTEERSLVVSRALNVFEEATKAVAAYERADLAGRLDGAVGRLEDPAFHVLVVGEFKQGKSTLVNALLGTDVCTVDDDIATAVPTAIGHAPNPTATVLWRPPDTNSGGDLDQAPEPERQEIAITDLADYITESGGVSGQQRVQSVEVGLPVELLADGLVVVDTPGVGGLGSAHSTITIGALPMADAVIFVSDASQEFSEPELEFMETARSMCPNLVCVLAKTDFYPAWRKIRDLDVAHLERQGIDAKIIPVSSTLHEHAVGAGDDELDAESGFPDLLAYLDEEVVSKAEQLVVRSAAADLLFVVTQLEAQFAAEESALAHPEGAEERAQELEETKAKADALKSQASGWQQTLTDGIADLNSDVDHDLRDRFRKINTQVDDSLEEIDPADAWAEFEPWLYRRVAEDVVNNYQFLQHRAHELSTQVAEHFDLASNEITVELDIANPGDSLSRVDVEAQIDVEVMTKSQSAFTAVRGGYIGVIMFTMLGGMVGLALGPIPIGIGMIMGRKAARDEKERQLKQRRLQARTSQRKYMDEAQFGSVKDSRDTLRQIQRTLRDYYKARGEELAASVKETLAGVHQALKSDETTRKKRLTDVEAELKRIGGLKKKVNVIAPGLVDADAGA